MIIDESSILKWTTKGFKQSIIMRPTLFENIKKVGLELFEKSQNVQNLYQNQVLETFAENLMKNTWSIETILLYEKIDFISKITKLNFVEGTIKSQGT